MKSAKLRCSEAITKRGERRLVTRSDVEIPRITTAVRQTSVMTPAPRVANQSGLGLGRRTPRASDPGSGVRPATVPTVTIEPSRLTSRAGTPSAVQPRRRARRQARSRRSQQRWPAYTTTPRHWPSPTERPTGARLRDRGCGEGPLRHGAMFVRRCQRWRDRRRTRGCPAHSVESVASATLMHHPPSGVGPDTATSPPQDTRTPVPDRCAAAMAARSAAHALPIAPRSIDAPSGSVTVRLTRSCSMLAHPGAERIWRSIEGPSAGRSTKVTV